MVLMIVGVMVFIFFFWWFGNKEFLDIVIEYVNYDKYKLKIFV